MPKAFFETCARILGEILSPTRCAACDELVKPTVLFCVACAATVEEARATASGMLVAPLAYGGASASAIARFKYARRADLGPRLGAFLARSIAPLRGEIDVVLPVPLHPRRLVERGYNQSALLAVPIAGVLGAPLAVRALRRVRHTPRQAGLDRARRLVNLDGAFVAERMMKGERVLLVDDVRTTGATLDACSRVLLAAGAREVRAAVVARVT